MVAESCVDRERRDFLERLDILGAQYAAARGPLSIDEKIRLIKVLNLLAIKYEYVNRFTYVTARPLGFLLDANNSCQLGCEACVHTFDSEFAKKFFNVPRKGVMKRDVHDRIMDEAGIYSFLASYYNKSESLLKKNIHEFLLAASKRRIYTRISSNLSFPKLDADSIVLSGLNMLDVSVDGATQATYERYRRGGNIDWVFENVRQLVAARKRHSRTTPVIRWKFLTFEHNIHEAEEAFRRAVDLEFDEISFSMPYPGPTVVPTPHPAYTPDGTATIHTLNTSLQESWVFETENGDISEAVDAALSEKFVERYDRLKSAHGSGFDERAPGRDHCDWLHYNTAFDAHGVIRPCCEGDYKDRGGFDFSDLRRDEDFLNTPRYVVARKFAMGERALSQGADQIGCFGCKYRPGPEANLGGVDGWLQFFGNRISEDLLTNDPLVALSQWSKHNHEGV